MRTHIHTHTHTYTELVYNKPARVCVRECVCVCHALFKVERAYLEGKQQNCLHTRLASARAAASPLVHPPLSTFPSPCPSYLLPLPLL